jgi:hypothetical protein
MWLIDTKTLKLISILNPEAYRYAILSHTWGAEEVTFDDMKNLAVAETKASFQKIRRTCERARSQFLDYAWVDTCCIDKSSSAELSESINSMFRWYALSTACYAWLEDWNGMYESMHASRWFTRGWTLQELVAPETVDFLDQDWACHGSKSTLGKIVSTISRIDLDVLQGRQPLSEVPVGRRMSWAALRDTTRPEDMAYSLLGIFDINMPLLYGEGQKAFLRLQEEIARTSSDLSLFAWSIPQGPTDGHGNSIPSEWSQQYLGVFANAPHSFQDCSTLVAQSNQFNYSTNFVITNKGLSIHTSLVQCWVNDRALTGPGLPLWCHKEESTSHDLAIPLIKTSFGYVRSRYGSIGICIPPFSSKHPFGADPVDPIQIVINKGIPPTVSKKIESDSFRFLSIEPKFQKEHIYDELVVKGFPPALWDPDRKGFHLAACTEFVGVVIIHGKSDVNLTFELRIVCGYSKDIGGCWATLVPKGRSSGLLHQYHLSLLLSMLQESNDENYANCWHGYQTVRQMLFQKRGRLGRTQPVRSNMLVQGQFELCTSDSFFVKDWGDTGLGARLECTENNNLEGANGQITVTIG